MSLESAGQLSPRRVNYYVYQKGTQSLVCLVKGHHICPSECKEDTCDDHYKAHCTDCNLLFRGVMNMGIPVYQGMPLAKLR